MISLASRSAARNCCGLIDISGEIDGAALVAHVKRDGREVVELLEGGRQHVLAGVLLHVVATALDIDRAADRKTRLQLRGLSFHDVQHVASLLVLRDFHHAQRNRFGSVGQIEPAGVEGLATAGGIKSRAVEHDGCASGRIRHGLHASVELVQEGVGVVEAIGHAAIIANGSQPTGAAPW